MPDFVIADTSVLIIFEKLNHLHLKNRKVIFISDDSRHTPHIKGWRAAAVPAHGKGEHRFNGVWVHLPLPPVDLSASIISASQCKF